MIEHIKKNWGKYFLPFLLLVGFVYIHDTFNLLGEFNLESGISELWSDVKQLFEAIFFIIGAAIGVIALVSFIYFYIKSEEEEKKIKEADASYWKEVERKKEADAAAEEKEKVNLKVAKKIKAEFTEEKSKISELLDRTKEATK